MMILNGTVDVATAAAVAVGYNNASVFADVFRKHFGYLTITLQWDGE